MDADGKNPTLPLMEPVSNAWMLPTRCTPNAKPENDQTMPFGMLARLDNDHRVVQLEFPRSFSEHDFFAMQVFLVSPSSWLVCGDSSPYHLKVVMFNDTKVYVEMKTVSFAGMSSTSVGSSLAPYFLLFNQG